MVKLTLKFLSLFLLLSSSYATSSSENVASTFQVTPVIEPQGSTRALGTTAPSGPIQVAYNSVTKFLLMPNIGTSSFLGANSTCGGSLSGNMWVTNPIQKACVVYAGFMTEYPVKNDSPSLIIKGANNNLWFSSAGYPAEQISSMDISTGAIQTYMLTGDIGSIRSITLDGQGNLWFAAYPNNIGKINPKTGQITEYSTAPPSSRFAPSPEGITLGSDGFLWFTEDDTNIGKINPNTGEITHYDVKTFTISITSDPDGNIWFTGNYFGPLGNMIGKMTPNGQLTEYILPDRTLNMSPGGITAGPDGTVWFTGNGFGLYDNVIGKITTMGKFTEYPIAKSSEGLTSITLGPDGNFWFVDQGQSKIGKITSDGQISEYNIPSAYPGPGPFGITVGPDKNLWFTEPGKSKLGVL